MHLSSRLVSTFGEEYRDISRAVKSCRPEDAFIGALQAGQSRSDAEASAGGGWGIVAVRAAFPDLGPAPRRSIERGRRVRFVIYTGILVVLICVAASVLSPSTGGHRQHRRPSASRASLGHLAPGGRVHAPYRRAE